MIDHPKAQGRHLVLLGAMGAGKTTVGRLVASRLGRPFLDSDEWIVSQSGRTGREVALEEGVKALHGLEVRMLKDAIALPEPHVIAAPASVVDRPAIVNLIQRFTIAVWLDAPTEALIARAATGRHRRNVGAADAEILARNRESSFAKASVARLDASLPAETLVETIVALARGGHSGES